MSTLTDKIEIKIDGKEYKEYNFLNIVLTQELLKPNEFRFTMQKKNAFMEEADVSFATPKELVGAKVSCLIKTIRFNEIAGQANETLEFEGIIFDVDISRSSMVSEILIHVVAYSPDYAMKGHKTCYSQREKPLGKLVENICDLYGFEKKIDPAFTKDIPYSVIYNETHYEYLVRLAKRYGEWFYYDGKKVIFGKVEKQQTLELYYRTDILSYTYSAKMKPRYDKASHVYFDYLKGGCFHRTLSTPEKGFLEFSDALEEKAMQLYEPDMLQYLECAISENNPADEYETSLHAQLDGIRAEMFVCSGKTVRADMLLGSCFKIKDLYDKEDNKYGNYDHDELLVTRIVHTADVNGFYQNEFTAISAKSDYPPYHDSDIFPVSENLLAVVIDTKDPEKLGRVRVAFIYELYYLPSKSPFELQEDEQYCSPWIQVAHPYGGGNMKGFYFVPEIGYLVMVGFEHGNAEKPYVIGTLNRNKEHTPDPEWYDDENNIKVLRTRDHTIEFHDLPNDAEAGGFMKIYDCKKKYEVTLSADDNLIKLKSKGNIVLEAGNNIQLKAGNDIKIKAKDEIVEDCEGNYFSHVGKNREILVEEVNTNIAKNYDQKAEEIYVESDSVVYRVAQAIDMDAPEIDFAANKATLSGVKSVEVNSVISVDIEAAKVNIN